MLPNLALLLALVGPATPTPTPTATPAPLGPLGARRLDPGRARTRPVIDNACLARLAAEGRVEQPEPVATANAAIGDDAIWQELAARSEADSEARDQWRTRLHVALDTAAAAEEAVTLAGADVGAAWIAYVREKKAERRELVLAPRLEVAKGRLAAARQRLERARREIDQVRRDARRAGVPPGWLRGVGG